MSKGSNVGLLGLGIIVGAAGAVATYVAYQRGLDAEIKTRFETAKSKVEPMVGKTVEKTKEIYGNLRDKAEGVWKDVTSPNDAPECTEEDFVN